MRLLRSSMPFALYAAPVEVLLKRTVAPAAAGLVVGGVAAGFWIRGKKN